MEMQKLCCTSIRQHQNPFQLKQLYSWLQFFQSFSQYYYQNIWGLHCIKHFTLYSFVELVCCWWQCRWIPNLYYFTSYQHTPFQKIEILSPHFSKIDSYTKLFTFTSAQTAVAHGWWWCIKACFWCRQFPIQEVNWLSDIFGSLLYIYL
jgi:hypothetical protein